MSRSIQDTMDEIIAFMWWNQNEKLDGEKENYVSNIARELNMTRPRVMRSLEWLENNISFVTSWKEGNKVCYRLRHDPYANISNESSEIAKENLSINPESLEEQKED